MVGFSQKAVQQTSSGDNTQVDGSAWNEWNQYIYSLFKAKEVDRGNGKKRKTKTVTGIVNFIMDLGYPKAADGEYDLKDGVTPPEDGEDYSESELAWKDKNPTHDFVWTKSWDQNANNGKGGMVTVRKQTSPKYPAQEYGLCVDVPSVMVDWSKHPLSTSDTPDLKPYRLSLNGVFNREVQRPVTFKVNHKTGLISDKNLVYKVCAAAGLEKDLISSGFDIATAAEAVCNFKMTLDLTENGDKVFLNDSISTPSAINDILDLDDNVIATVDQQVEKARNTKGLAPFTGILLNGMDCTEDMFKMLGSDKYGFIKRASTSTSWEIKGSNANGDYCFDKGLDYETSDFAKAYKEYLEGQGIDTDKPKSTPAKKPSLTTMQSLEEAKQQHAPVNPGTMDFDEEIPF